MTMISSYYLKVFLRSTDSMHCMLHASYARNGMYCNKMADTMLQTLPAFAERFGIFNFSLYW